MTDTTPPEPGGHENASPQETPVASATSRSTGEPELTTPVPAAQEKAAHASTRNDAPADFSEKSQAASAPKENPATVHQHRLVRATSWSALATAALALFTFQQALATREAIERAKEETSQLIRAVTAVEDIGTSVTRLGSTLDKQQQVLENALTIQKDQGTTFSRALELAGQNLSAPVPDVVGIRCGEWVNHVAGDTEFSVLDPGACPLVQVVLRNTSAIAIRVSAYVTFKEIPGVSCPVAGKPTIEAGRRDTYSINLRHCLARNPGQQLLTGAIYFTAGTN